MKKKWVFLVIATTLIGLTACASKQAESRTLSVITSNNTAMVELSSKNLEPSISHPYDSAFPQHEPHGTGVGAMPGRVVWTHDPDSVNWDGEEYWWQESNFDEAVIQEMVRNSIAALGNTENAEKGWDILFKAHNSARGKTDAGYVDGQKIVIKANMNGSYSSGNTRASYTNPVLLKTLLISLVEDAGVEPSDITVFDTCRVFPNYMVEMCTSGILKGVRFQFSDPLGDNDVTADRSAPVVWSQKFGGETTYIPTCVTEAEYMINLANLKGHTYGITLSAKNHFGSIINSSRISPPEAARIHQFLTNHKMDAYTVLVDLLANYQLGEKTMLYILDALICAPSEAASISGDNSRWQQSPFNNDYTSSIFVSQDPVAIDSVGADFLMNETVVTERNSALKDNSTVENYLHEAGLVANAPSGAAYYNGDGERITNLGVHEHWNNSTDKQYSRNLGKGEGIELVYLSANGDVQDKDIKK